MKPIRLAVVFVAAAFAAPHAAPLSVIRIHPSEPADPLTEITVTFDRPVSGSLDAIVDASKIFRIEPAIQGKLEWRDPVTLRFKPATPLTPGESYRVTISNDFEAMDGTRLPQPYSFTVRIDPARVIGGEPINATNQPRFIVPSPLLSLVISSPVDPRVLVDQTYITMTAPCSGRIPVALVQVRRIRSDDPPELRYTGGYYVRTDSARDTRRVVEIRPQTPLPNGCPAQLNVPAELRPGASMQAWPFQTYGALNFAVARCARDNYCATGPIEIEFSTPVRGADVMRHVRVEPKITFTVDDTSGISERWFLTAPLQPRQHYAVVVDSMMRDVFGQRLARVDVKAFATTGYAPTVIYDHGKLLVERKGLRTLAVQVINVDTLIVTTIAVPESAEASFLAETWRWSGPFDELRARAVERRIPLKPEPDKPFIVGVPIPANDARVTRNGTLYALRMRPAKQPLSEAVPIALVQVTDLAVHGRMGIDAGQVWVTGVTDGKPRVGATVNVHDALGKLRATAQTDAQGLARFSNLRPAVTPDCDDDYCGERFDGYLSATLLDDRAVVGVNAWDPDLAAWRFDISSAWSPEQRIAAAAAVFTERGIYRPGERVYAKAIVRTGPLGALVVPRGDSLKWTFRDREGGVLKDTTTLLTAFGTAQQSIALPSDVPLGIYSLQLALKRSGQWRTLANTTYQVAEYRPPEFLVDVNADNAPRFAGDVVNASVTARYLFGAPMAGARVRWIVQHRPMWFWELDIPGTEEWSIGGYDDEDEYFEENESTVAEEGVDSLDARGNLELKIKMPVPKGGRPARTGILAVVTDANRQTVSAGRSIIVHPAAFYIGAKTRGKDYFWRAGTPVEVDVIALRPNGERVSGVNVQGVIVRREWHQVRRIRNGQVSDVGNWVSDTVATCRVQTASDPGMCGFTPSAGGSYMIAFTATDAQGRVARTTMWRWAAGPNYVPWRDKSKLQMQIIADKQRYSVGDTATLLVASPFTNVEAWVTIERERVLQSRRMLITSGATTIKVPITEGLAPNAYISILLVRGRSARPGPVDDPGRPTLRVGYTELRVVPAVKQLNVDVSPLQPEYRPGDTARIALKITDKNGVGQRSEVTLWAVDEGVLALTGYQVPDPVALLYEERPLGVRLASNLTAVAAQVPEGQKGKQNPGGGGGADVAGVLRSRFQTTAFFIGSVVTNAGGTATVRARLPDNLTTFRVMAVAVTAGDRYGSGKSSMLVTRPLLARPSLPRFVREGDRFSAGVVVNQRTAGTQRVEVEATSRGIALRGAQRKSETLNGAAGREVRFDFTAQNTDSAHFQFAVRGTSEADAVAVRIPVKENYHPLAQTIAGTVHDTSTAVFTLEQDVDPARSTLEISFGSSTMAVVRGARRTLRVYPYYCTEQVASMALPLIALYRAQREVGGTVAPTTAAADIRLAIRMIARRQNPDGGIGYWTSNDWSTPWLTAYSTRVLLEAREAGFTVDKNILDRVADYLNRSLHEPIRPQFAISRWYEDQRMRLAERVAAVDILSRLGKPDVPVENSLLAQAGQLAWEDRLVLAEVFARRNANAQARQLLANAWSTVTFSGRTLNVPRGDGHHYFISSARPAARLLTATLIVDPNHQYLGQLVETLVQHGRAAARDLWNTQDYGSTVLALMAFERRRQGSPGGTIRFSGEAGALLTRNVGAGEIRDTSFALTGLVRGNTVRVNVNAESPAPIYYFLTVREVPRVRAVRPIDRGIQVERWYERLDTRAPTTRVAAGELVRVRLRITIPEERRFVVLDDPLPAGLEAVDLSLRTVRPEGIDFTEASESPREDRQEEGWYFGSWDSGVWSAFDYKELRDDRVIYFATYLWKGTYTATYLARATTAGTFFMPPAHAEEMYNPAVNGRTGGGEFVVTEPAR